MVGKNPRARKARGPRAAQAPIKNGGPKHEQVRELLRRQIHAGLYPPGTRLPPESELPRLLNVGNQTVRHALNDLVREGLIVRRRGSGSYVADRRMRPILPGRELKLGVLWHQSVWPERMKGTFQGALTLGAVAALGLSEVEPSWPMVEPDAVTRAVWSDKARRLRVEALGEASKGHPRHPPLDAIKAGGFDGLLVMSIVEDAVLERILALGVPAVFVDVLNERFLDAADQIFVDPYVGYRHAVRHFASQGLTRIHFVPGYMGKALPGPEAGPEEREAYRREPMRMDPDSFLRLSAYRQGMDECGLPVPDEFVHFAPDPTQQMEQLIPRMLALPPARRPQAVLAHNMHQARDLGAAAARAGWTLAGAGAGAVADPALDGIFPIHIDSAAMGEVAVELLAARLQRPERPCLRVGVPMRFQTSGAAPAPRLASKGELHNA